ncbi:hypothetical protein [Saccharolobus islandicus]|uniref:Uncharacterized protein n=1 Tax=Saccharolobus islandicus (strain M.16.4 / Kamchatka \|nr:hypothetical protein [Sulfolobus islandicus]ACR41612.1 conserved hypothetical protein [Sulfolobus islandicus M.16.4]
MLKSYDAGWELHKRFYESIHKFLNNGANIILVENSEGSNERDFVEFIQKGRLEYVKTIHPKLNDIIEALYINIRGLDLNFGISKVIKNLPYSIYRLAFLIGFRIYEPAIKNVSFYSKFYFIWSRYR